MPFRPFKFDSYRRFISQSEHAELTRRCKPEFGDLLVSKIGTLGLTKFVDVNYEFSIFVGLALLKLKKTLIDGRYLEQVLNDHTHKQSMIAASPGSTRATLTLMAIEKLQVPVPSLETQRKIAEVLSTVDRAIEQTEALIAKQQRIKTGLMQDLLTRGIDEHGNLRSEETHEFKDSPLGRIPVEWEVDRIENSSIELIDGDRGENYPKQHDLLADGYCLFLSAKNVTRTGLRFAECQFISASRDRKMGSGKTALSDIILTTRGTVGHFGFVTPNVPYSNIRINSGMIILRSREQRLIPEYLYESYRNYIFKTEYQKTVSGSAQPQLPARDIVRFHFLKPKPREQQAIISLCHGIEASRQNEEAQLSKLRSLKTALMQDLLTGKKHVTPLLEADAEQAAGSAS